MFMKTTQEKADSLADQALKSTQHVLNDAINNVTNSVHELQHQVKPLLGRAGDQVSSLAHNGIEHVLDTSRQMRDQAVIASRRSAKYVKDEPVKSVLIAAAIGVAVFALISLFDRSNGRR